MRTLACGVVMIVVAMVGFGCASGGLAKAGAAETKLCVMQSGGRDVLRLTVPADAECTSKDGSVHMKSRDRYVDVWLVLGARTVDEAMGRVGREITSEFKDFKLVSTTGLAIAGTPAKRLMGSGVEADDGDPGTADVIVFKAGGHIFVACTHGESLTAGAQQFMVSVVQSTQAP